MALNYPGPGQIRLYYSVEASPGGTLQHVLNLNVEPETTPTPGTPLTSILLKNGVGGTSSVTTVVDALVDLLDNFFNSAAMTFDYAELWSYAAGSFDATYIGSYTLSAAGVSAVGVQKASQMTWVWRTSEGGVLKMVLLDTTRAPDEPIRYGDLSAEELAVANYFVTGATAFFLGRDTSRPVGFRGLYNGQNEKTFRQRYRP